MRRAFSLFELVIAIAILAVSAALGSRLWIAVNEAHIQQRASTELRGDLYRITAQLSRLLNIRIQETLAIKNSGSISDFAGWSGDGDMLWYSLFIEAYRAFDGSSENGPVIPKIVSGVADLSAISPANNAQITISTPATNLALLNTTYRFDGVHRKDRTLLSAILASPSNDMKISSGALAAVFHSGSAAAYYNSSRFTRQILDAGDGFMSVASGDFTASDIFYISHDFFTLSKQKNTLKITKTPHFLGLNSSYILANNLKHISITKADDLLKIDLCLTHKKFKIDGSPLTLCHTELVP